MMQVRVMGVAYRPIAGEAPTARIALAHRRGETSPVVRNFIARVVTLRLCVLRFKSRSASKGRGLEFGP